MSQFSHLTFTKKSSLNQQKGLKAEQLTLKFLLEKGATLMEKNLKTPYGEIDLIVLYQNIILFIEVKIRKNERFSPIHETITYKKKQCLEQSITYIMQKKPEWQQRPQRLDAILIIEEPFEIRWLQQL